MTDSTTDTFDYVHGNSSEEQQRLSLLNTILNDACLKELDVKPGESVLDFGSGLGQFTRMIAKAAGEQSQIIGIERDPSQVEQAQKLAESSNETALVEFREGDATAVPLQESEWGTFELAHARFLLEHVPGPELVVAQMARSVRSGGRVFICDDDHGDFRPWPEPPGFQKIWRAYVGTFSKNGSDPYVGRKLVSLLSRAGLTPVRNGGVFFGGCAGDEKFEATAENLIAAFLGAKDAMLSVGPLDEDAYNTCVEELEQWKNGADSALWYSACFAEAIK